MIKDRTKTIILITLTLLYILLCVFTCQRKPVVAESATPPAKIEVHHELTGWEALTMAIIATESEFDSLAVSDHDARGILQITQVYVDDVNRIIGREEYSLADAFSVQKSLEMFNIYQGHYNPEHDIEKAIRLHNPTAGRWYEVRVLKNYRNIIKQEEIVKLIKEAL